MILTVVTGDYWEGFYIDGVLREQGHSLDWIKLIDQHLIGASITKIDQLIPNQEWLDDNGSLPELLSEVILENSNG